MELSFSLIRIFAYLQQMTNTAIYYVELLFQFSLVSRPFIRPGKEGICIIVTCTSDDFYSSQQVQVQTK